MKFTDLFIQNKTFFNELSCEGLGVRAVKSSVDFDAVCKLRDEGYKMYFKNAKNSTKYEILPNETIFLATDHNDAPIGTIRMLDRSLGPIELDTYVDVVALLDRAGLPCTEASRLAIRKHPDAFTVKLLLWKAYLRYSLIISTNSLLISSRPIYARDYLFLSFVDVGQAGAYRHPMLNKAARTYRLLSVQGLKERWWQESHPLHDFMFEQSHNIIYD